MCVYHRVLFTFKHLMGLTLLIGLPVVFLLAVNARKPLWWLGTGGFFAVNNVLTRARRI